MTVVSWWWNHQPKVSVFSFNETVTDLVALWSLVMITAIQLCALRRFIDGGFRKQLIAQLSLLLAISGGSGRGLPRCWANLWIVGFPLRWANLYSTGFHGAGIAQYQPTCRLMVDRLRAAVSLPKRATAAAVTSSASLILSTVEKVSFGLRDLKWHSWAWEKYRVVMRTWNIILV